MDKADTQTAMHTCASEEARRVDVDLDDIYNKLLSAARNQSGAVEKTKVLQKAWTAYRDAYIDAMYPAENKLAVYGSVFLTEVNLLRAKLTYQQIVALKNLIKQYSSAE